MALHVEDGRYVLCPFCAFPLTEEVETKRRSAEYYGRGSFVVPCNACGFDVTRAPVVQCAIREVEVRTMPPCAFCDGFVAGDAPVCAACKRWQHPKTAAQRAHNDEIHRVMPPRPVDW